MSWMDAADEDAACEHGGSPGECGYCAEEAGESQEVVDRAWEAWVARPGLT